ncbi:2Fe-2S iron-sulfur cluster-binding protein [Hydrogenobacter hydrogenophilus]|uniref:NADH-quinone oxidoreductase subunit G n=1 Tax=Hydrogenobacter hydrogenophilus TaxID=35835 RepID=A0A285NW16_9AQUI|nr:2Fe-2S iron-sulfur cluster-binding protein [Hydrogenobacter hydrogenophilus]SNZ13655.1 NADH-quinone oxidoreductase subunit G [Hydrogenobacter hydrogenophilus]
MERKVKIVVDGREIEAQEGVSLLEVLLKEGISVPYFCYHPKLKVIGACRMCIVYNEKTGRLITSCNTKVEDGMSISTQHELVKNNQKYLLQAFMTRHPLDCPICDKAGECDLQNHGAIFGPQRQIVPVSALEKERHYIDWESDFLEYYTNRCVVCYRCTRVCDDVNGARALYVEERGFHANIVPTVRPIDTSSCEMCGLCVYVCPVGAIISKPFKYWSRSWLLQKERTVCNVCPVGCEIQVEYGIGDWRSKQKVYRTKPTDDLNICAKAFFGYDAHNTNRLLKPYIYGKEESAGNVVNFIASLLKNYGENTAIIISSYLSNEILENIKDVAIRSGSYVCSTLTEDFYAFLEGYGDYTPIYIDDIKSAENYILFGEDITSTAPVLSYYVKGKVYKYGSTYKDAKFKPIVFNNLEELYAEVPSGGVLIANTTGIVGSSAKSLGEFVRRLSEDKAYKVLVLHKDANYLGVYKTFGKDTLSNFGGIVNGISEGLIKNLIVFGEELLDYYHMQELTQVFDKLEKLVVFSPFADGLSELAHVKVPMELYGEMDGTYHTLMGLKKGKRFLPWSFNSTAFFSDLLENLPKVNKGIKVIKGECITPKRLVHLYKSNWITDRSENLKKLYEKNSIWIEIPS